MIELLAQRWTRAVAAATTRAGGHPRGTPRVRYAAPATDGEILAAERAMGRAVPEAVKALYRLASAVDVRWDLGETDPPKPFHQIFAGECAWDLARQHQLLETYDGWIREVFSNPHDPYDRVWHDKFPVFEVGNGDLIAADLDGRPTYLSHDDGEGHGYVLGREFVDFVDRWSRVGCPGPEDWQWLPFTSSRDSYIDPNGEAARAWRAWLGLIETA